MLLWDDRRISSCHLPGACTQAELRCVDVYYLAGTAIVNPPGKASRQHIWNARPARVNAPPTLSSPLSNSQTLQDYM